jgi:energy-coupling factor transport system ATP-binding protein
VITFDRATFTYPDAARPTFADVSFSVGEGELCLVVGPTGSGKSTLLRAVNGLVPRFTGGLLTGEVRVDGRRTEDQPPRELADVVGYVGQDPMAGFVTDTVTEELAYVMENLGVAPDVMRRRVEDVLDLLGLHELRRRPLRALSGGQQQRVAIGSVLTASPRILVLDEPTSALDPAAAEDVLAALTRLVHDLGITVLIAEHRLERVVQYADRVVLLPGPGHDVVVGDPADVLAGSPIVPPVVELGRLAGWSPLPLSIRDARRLAAPLREQLEPRVADVEVERPTRGSGEGRLVVTEHLHASYGDLEVLGDVSIEVGRGEVVAIMGRNGSGKSTLLAHIVGLRRPVSGSVEVDGVDPAGLAPTEAIKRVGLVPQDPTLLLYHDSVAEECTSADLDSGLAPGTTSALLEAVVPGVDPSTHPRDLSEGQRLGVALAIVLAAGPPVVLLDEPTRGLDYAAKHRLVEVLDGLAGAGHVVILATHDVEVVAQLADRVIVLADGDVVADGPAREVVCHSPIFAPQVSKVLAPQPWLTVVEVAAALAGEVAP